MGTSVHCCTHSSHYDMDIVATGSTFEVVDNYDTILHRGNVFPHLTVCRHAFKPIYDNPIVNRTVTNTLLMQAFIAFL